MFSRIGMETKKILDNNSHDILKHNIYLKPKKICSYLYNDYILAVFPYYDENKIEVNNNDIINSEYYNEFNNKILPNIQNFEYVEVSFDNDEFINSIEVLTDNNVNENEIYSIIFYTTKGEKLIGKPLIDYDKKKFKVLRLCVENEFIIGLKTSYNIKNEDNKKFSQLSSLKIYTIPSNDSSKYYRKKRNYCLLSFNIIFSLLLVPAAILLYYFFSQNITKGLIILNDDYLTLPTKLYTDENGFVHIRARNFGDGLFTLGMAHARDRLWQMEFTRRLAKGKLSEILGNKALKLDKMMRSVSINYESELDVERIKNDTEIKLEYFNKYVAGINYYANNNYLPPEYYILNIKFENWTISDSIAISRLLGFSMNFDWHIELFNHLIEQTLGKKYSDLITIFYDKFPYSDETVLSREEIDSLGLSKIDNKKTKYDSGSNMTLVKSNETNNLNITIMNPHASNSWVISGNLTKSGKPILANDPHLGNKIPSIHYIVKFYIGKRLNSSEIIVGSSPAGLPFVLIGNNKYISWGLTTDNRDASDLCEEKIEGDYYILDNNKFLFDTRKEIIKVNGESDHELIIRSTHNGPIIDEFIKELSIMDSNYKISDSRYGLSLRLHLKDEYYKTYKFFFNLSLSKSNEDILKLSQDYVSPFLALTWANINGDIGYTTLGKVSIKNNKESKICKGYNSSNDFISGYIPKNETPVMINPKKGYIVTANNRQFAENYKHYVQSYSYHNRFHRINQLLRNKFDRNKKFDVKTSIKILSDVHDSYAEVVLPKLLNILERNNLSNNTYYSLLKNFNYKFDKNSKEATLYAVFEYNLGLHLLLKNQENNVEYGYDNKLEARSILNIFTFWNFFYDFIDKVESKVETNIDNCRFFSIEENCEQYIITVFNNLDEYLKDYIDGNSEIMTWGEVHFNYYPHSFDSNNLMKKLFSRKIGTGGNRNTVKVSKNKFSENINGPFTSVHSANLKYICDLNDITRPYISLDTGNSGNILSRYYENMLNTHEDNKLVKIKNHIFNDDVNLLISFPEHNTLIIRNK